MMKRMIEQPDIWRLFLVGTALAVAVLIAFPSGA